MKIGLLSRNANLYSTMRLKEAAEGRGHDVRVIDYLRCVIDITSHKPAIRYAGQELEGYRRQGMELVIDWLRSRV